MHTRGMTFVRAELEECYDDSGRLGGRLDPELDLVNLRERSQRDEPDSCQQQHIRCHVTNLATSASRDTRFCPREGCPSAPDASFARSDRSGQASGRQLFTARTM